MKKTFLKVCARFIFFMMLISQLSGYSFKAYAAAYILDDAFVSNMSGKSDTVMTDSTPTKLTVGKLRHAYMKFDLSSIDIENTEKIILNMTKINGANTLVYNECSNYLTDKTTGEESDVLWTKDNMTFNSKPLDLTDSKQYTVEMANGTVKLKLDLTELFEDAIGRGKTEVTVHFTTADVDDSTISASDIYSTRNSENIPSLSVTKKNSEVPVSPEGINIGDYLQNASIATKTFKMKAHDGDDNSYVRVQDDGTIKSDSDVDSASIFALYTYQYGQDMSENYGSTINTYAIKCLDNNKYITIQNYFSEDEESKDYYNKKDDGTFEIKASADEVNYNERFYLNDYLEGGYYEIYSHLNTLRDDPSFSKSIVRADENAMTSSLNNTDDFYFDFLDVSGNDKLEVSQKVSGTTATLVWKAVNGDTDINNYQVSENADITENNGFFTAKINDLEQGKTSDVTVTYSNGSINESDTVEIRIFNHPGLLLSNDDLEAMKEHVQNKEEPWYSDYLKLNSTVPNKLSSYEFSPNAHDGVGRGTPAGSGNIADFEQSASAAYFNALQWVVTGDSKYADTAVNILNSWADTLKVVDGRDRILGAGINSYKLANAAEIIRYYNGGYSGYSQSDFSKLQDMMRNVIYPAIQDLGSPMIANGNWDTAAMISMISIGELCDDSVIYDRAVSLYQDIHVNGSIAVYVSDSGQSVESGRDQAHAQLGIGYMAEVCQVAQNQDDDLYGLYDNRLAKAFEYAAKYNLYEDVDYTALPNVFGDTSRGYWDHLNSEKVNRGELRPVYELPLSYYRNVSGVDVTWMSKAAEAMRPQGYVHNDNLNFGTLTSYNGDSTDINEPYFLIRTRLEPWYQRTLTKVDGEYVEETLNSYFAPDEDGTLKASSERKDAPYYQLENNEDGTYSLRCAATNKYLSVKDDKVGDYNEIKADADTIGDDEKFTLYCNGASFYFLRSPSHDNRIVYVDITDSDGNSVTSSVNKDDADDYTLTMYLGSDSTEDIANLNNNEKFILVYNTEETALNSSSDSIEITDVEVLDDIYVKQGTSKDDIDLPELVDLDLSDNTTTSAAVKWTKSEPEYDKDKEGTYKFIGKITLPDDVENPDDLTAEVDVIVTKDGNPQEGDDSDKITIKSVEKLDDITVKQGTSKGDIDLPETVVLELSDNTTTSAAVKWTKSEPEYDKDKEGTYKFIGRIILPDDIKNPNNLKAEINVIVEDDKNNEEIKNNTSHHSSHHKHHSSSDSDTTDTSNSAENTDQSSDNTVIADNNNSTDNLSGWRRDSKNNWVYYNDSKNITGWNKIDNVWYLFDTEGVMKTGWNKVQDKWYYLEPNGAMVCGWIYDNDKWYYLNEDGSMKDGWLNSSGIWYYLNENGDMQSSGWKSINGQWYYFNDNGSMAYDTSINGYILNENGQLI